jgi:hypothetical protein
MTTHNAAAAPPQRCLAEFTERIRSSRFAGILPQGAARVSTILPQKLRRLTRLPPEATRLTSCLDAIAEIDVAGIV